MYALLLRQRLRLAWYGAVRGRHTGPRVLGLVVLGLAGAGAFTLALVFSRLYFQAVARDDPTMPPAYLPVLFAALALFALVACLRMQVHSLFLASDLDLLLAAPVSPRDLFLVKLTESAAAGALPALGVFAVLVGYGQARDAGPAFSVAAALLVAATAAIGAALSMCLLLLVARWAPVRHLRAALTVAGVLATVGFWLAFRLATPDQTREATRSIDPTVDRVSGALPGPATWAGDALTALESGDGVGLAMDVALLCAVGAAAAGAAYALFRRTLAEGRGRVREVAPRRRRGGTGGGLSLLASLPPSVRAITAKELRTFLREPRLMAGLIFPLVFGVVTVLQPGRRGSGGGLGPGLLILPLMLLTGISVPLAAVGREGRAFAVLLGAPVSMRRVLWGKALAYAAVWTALGCLILAGVAVARGGDAPRVALGVVMAAWLSTGASAAAVAGGALDARFDADNPMRGAGCLGQVLAMLVGAAFLGAGTAWFVWLALLVGGAVSPGLSIAAAVTALLAACALAAAGLVVWFVGVAADRLAEEEVV